MLEFLNRYKTQLVLRITGSAFSAVVSVFGFLSGGKPLPQWIGFLCCVFLAISACARVHKEERRRHEERENELRDSWKQLIAAKQAIESVLDQEREDRRVDKAEYERELAKLQDELGRPNLTVAVTANPHSTLPGQASNLFLLRNIGKQTAVRISIGEINISMSPEIVKQNKEAEEHFFAIDGESAATEKLPTEWVVRFTQPNDLDSGEEAYVDYQIENMGVLQMRDLKFAVLNSYSESRFLRHPLLIRYSDDGCRSWSRAYDIVCDTHLGSFQLEFVSLYVTSQP